MVGLWLARHRDANAWYHIYPFALASNNSVLHIVRHKKIEKLVPNTKYHLYKSRGLIIDLIKIFIKGFNTLLTHRIDYVVTFNPVPWGSIAWVLAKIFRKPIILGFIGADFHHYLMKTRWKSFLKFASLHSEVVTITGNHMREEFLKIGVNNSNIFVYPHCVPDKWFSDISSGKKKYDIITVCNLIPLKRVQDIILAVDILNKKEKKISLCIVGDGIERKMLEGLVEDRGLQNQIYFAGWQSDVQTFLNQARIYVQASYAEGFSISLIEAIASGLIPITTLAGSEADYIKDGYNGYIFEIGNYEQLAEKIESALDPQIFIDLQNELLKTRENFRTSKAISVCEVILEKIWK